MYKGLEARLHDVFWDVEAGGIELELIKGHLDGSKERCLEIGCGSGRILLPLREAGYQVDGNDVSLEMLNLLEQNEGGSPPVGLFHGKTTDQEVSQYAHYLIPAFTFMLMSEGEGEEMLTYLSENTAAGSSLYLTIFMPWAEICGELEEGEWYKDHEAKRADGSVAQCRTQFEIDRTRQQLKRKHRYSLKAANGKKETSESEQLLRWYSYQEMMLLLRNTGWKVGRTLFDLDESADSTNAHIYTFIAIVEK